MKELVIISGKGGTGKTSVTAALASLGGSMVLADCDVDAADLHLVLAPDTKRTEPFVSGELARIDPDACTHCGECREHCRYNAIDDSYRVTIESCEGCGVCAYVCPAGAAVMEPRLCGDWYTSETRFGTMVHARLGIGEENSGKLVTTVRKAAKEIAEERQVDLMLTDGPPGIGCPVIASLGGADMALAVAEPTNCAVHDLERVRKLAAHFDIPLMVVINKADINTELVDDIRQFCRMENVEVAGELPYHRGFTQAQLAGQSVVEFDPEGLGKTLQAVRERILQHL